MVVYESAYRERDIEQYDQQREQAGEKIGVLMRQMIESGHDPAAVLVGMTRAAGPHPLLVLTGPL